MNLFAWVAAENNEQLERFIGFATFDRECIRNQAAKAKIHAKLG